MFTSGLTMLEACLIGLSAVSVVGLGIMIWLASRSSSPAAEAPAPAPAEADFEAAAVHLDAQAAAILELVRTYEEAGTRYSVTLAQADKSLALATREQIGIIVKFLLAENAKMQNEAGELRSRLEQSRTQIDKLRAHLAEAQEIGLRDPLTSLSNRRCFDASLARELADAKARGVPLSLVMGDIDNFKKINDLYGHQIGDEILKTFASVLTDNVRARDTVARYGGEEFAIILPDTHIESAQAAHRARTPQDREPAARRHRERQADRHHHRIVRHRRARPRRRRRGADPARRSQALRGQVRRQEPRRRRSPGCRLRPRLAVELASLTLWHPDFRISSGCEPTFRSSGLRRR